MNKFLDAVPPWTRNCFCPWCKSDEQPKDGFDLVEFTKHVDSHKVVDLCDTVSFANRMYDALKELQSRLEWCERFDSPNWFCRMQMELALIRSFPYMHGDDGSQNVRDAWDRWTRKYKKFQEQSFEDGAGI